MSQHRKKALILRPAEIADDLRPASKLETKFTSVSSLATTCELEIDSERALLIMSYQLAETHCNLLTRTTDLFEKGGRIESTPTKKHHES